MVVFYHLLYFTLLQTFQWVETKTFLSVWRTECSTHLAQQEELVSTLLSVFVTGALHLLQVNSVQLELLRSGRGGELFLKKLSSVLQKHFLKSTVKAGEERTHNALQDLNNKQRGTGRQLKEYGVRRWRT